MRKLRKASGDAIARIVRLADDTALEKPGVGMFAWGQFLDGPRNVDQYGLFGTAAAVQVLVKGHGQSHAKVRQSREWLPEIEPEPVPSTNVLDKTDLGLTFKVAAVLAAAEQDSNDDFLREEQIEKRLVAALVEGKGWGHFHYPVGGETATPTGSDTTPQVLPTVHALLALKPSRKFRSSTICTGVLEWLSHTVIQREDLRPHELALAGLALQAYRGQGVELSNYGEALDTITGRLSRWVRVRNRARDEHYSHHYFAPTGPGGAQHTHYMFYLPHVLTARYFLRLSEVPEEVKTYVLEVVQATVNNVRENGGFKSAGSEKVGTLDQLEVYALLQAFYENADNPTSLLSPAIRVVSQTRTRRTLTSVLLIAAALVCGSAPFLEVPLSVKVSGGFVAALATTVLGALWYSWFGGE